MTRHPEKPSNSTCEMSFADIFNDSLASDGTLNTETLLACRDSFFECVRSATRYARISKQQVLCAFKEEPQLDERNLAYAAGLARYYFRLLGYAIREDEKLGAAIDDCPQEFLMYNVIVDPHDFFIE